MDSIPSNFPIILLMDSRVLHINPSIISLAKLKFVFTFPGHTSHLLQPLDIAVYKPLKTNWISSFNEHMKKNLGDKPKKK